MSGDGEWASREVVTPREDAESASGDARQFPWTAACRPRKQTAVRRRHADVPGDYAYTNGAPPYKRLGRSGLLVC
jgi:hypothetical protein